jgi:peptidoglycan hydrolase CwlO-like protein
MKKKETTIDDLAFMVQRGFLGVEKRLGSVEGKLSSVEKKVGKLEVDIEEIKETVGNIEANLNKKVDKIDHNTLVYRVEKLERKFA